jgi:LacI family transcriptional regulator
MPNEKRAGRGNSPAAHLERAERPPAKRERIARIKLSDVAREAGVSTASVSRVLNRDLRVNPRIRDQVQAAVERLGYRPNSAARALASRKFQKIGAIVPTLQNPAFAAGVEALQHRLGHEGYALIVASSDYNPEIELMQARMLMSVGVDAMMLIGFDHLPALYDLLDESAVPFVNAWAIDRSSDRPCVGFDNRAAAAGLTRYLIDLGHRAFAVVSGIRKSNDRASERVAGIGEALAERGLELRLGRLIEVPYRIFESQLALRALMAEPERPTAIICGNDIQAFGVLIECQSLGIRVPETVSVAGFDDLDFAAHINPPLTTVQVPAEEIGKRAADYLLARLSGKPSLGLTEIRTNLLVRASTGPPRRRAETAPAAE